MTTPDRHYFLRQRVDNRMETSEDVSQQLGSADIHDLKAAVGARR